MDGPPFLVSVLVNQKCYIDTLLDGGCFLNGLISFTFVSRCKLERLKISVRFMIGFDQISDKICDEVVAVRLDIGNYTEQACFYVVPQLANHDMILGQPWMEANDAVYSPKRGRLLIRSTGIIV